MQTQLETQGQVYEAESALQTRRARVRPSSGSSPRRGFPGAARESPATGRVIVAGEVPEGKIGLVRGGSACTVRFLALPDELLSGRVVSVGPEPGRRSGGRCACSSRSRTRGTPAAGHVRRDRPGHRRRVRRCSCRPTPSCTRPLRLRGRRRRRRRLARRAESQLGELHGDKVEILEGLDRRRV